MVGAGAHGIGSRANPLVCARVGDTGPVTREIESASRQTAAALARGGAQTAASALLSTLDGRTKKQLLYDLLREAEVDGVVTAGSVLGGAKRTYTRVTALRRIRSSNTKRGDARRPSTPLSTSRAPP